MAKVTIEDIASAKFCLDMRGSASWGKRVHLLREILKLAAPKKDSYPAFTFTDFYYCHNGYWYGSSWQKYPPVSVFDVVLPEAAQS